ncbi:MAG: 8-oxo-dGTP diphosphatase [Patescibacteria group bacterium]
MKSTTLCFLVKGNKVLLAMKKRGFGMGKFNGVGGKVERVESIVDACVREAQEEIGVEINKGTLTPRAHLQFYFDGRPEWDQVCHVFVAKKWEGEPVETEEMKPEWFPVAQLPFEKMWIDDPLWLPKVLAGQALKAEFHFTADGSKLLSHAIENVQKLDN